MGRIFLSSPDIGADERTFLLDALDSNWIAPLGPHVDAFEQEVADVVGARHAVALSSGTAALHLSLLVAGVGPGDEVLVPTLTFVATANAAVYAGAVPRFIDSERSSWNIDPNLVEEELYERTRQGRKPAAVIAVDLYGQCCDYGRLERTCREYEIPLIEDAAEALGATYGSRQAGSLGDMSVLSFNGNKIITTSGGGMLLTDNSGAASRARHLAAQARVPSVHYQHDEVGFNYRLSNLLAALGRGQLRHLSEKVERRRHIFARYREGLSELEGLSFMEEAPYGRSTRWLTVVMIDSSRFGAGRQELIRRLEAEGIEARPAWKPMHCQPAFAGLPVRGGAVAESMFDCGLCLPSGSGLTDSEIDRVIDVMFAVYRAKHRLAVESD